MTRKDYVLIADALRQAYVVQRDRYVGTSAGVRAAAEYISDALASDNPRFDRERFLKAAGVQS